ncbi:MAG: DUF4242 domain-containing protein, partial [Chitinophagaceae bacterium]
LTEASAKTPESTEATAVPTTSQEASASYYIDEHNLEPGKVKFEDVAGAHAKDLATQGKYGVEFVKYWVDEKQGKVYCLSKAANEESITNTHKEAHGLVPAKVFQVAEGKEAALLGNKQMFIDIHEMGEGKVKAADVAGVHEKDLAVQNKYGVNFVNYWVDEKKGVVMCLSEAPDAASVKKTHQEAHGMLPGTILQVKQGQ